MSQPWFSDVWLEGDTVNVKVNDEGKWTPSAHAELNNMLKKDDIFFAWHSGSDSADIQLYWSQDNENYEPESGSGIWDTINSWRNADNPSFGDALGDALGGTAEAVEEVVKGIGGLRDKDRPSLWETVFGTNPLSPANLLKRPVVRTGLLGLTGYVLIKKWSRTPFKSKGKKRKPLRRRKAKDWR